VPLSVVPELMLPHAHHRVSTPASLANAVVVLLLPTCFFIGAPVPRTLQFRYGNFKFQVLMGTAIGALGRTLHIARL